MPQTTLSLFKHLNVINYPNSSTILPQLLFHVHTSLEVFTLLRLSEVVIALQSWFVTLVQSEYIIQILSVQI